MDRASQSRQTVDPQGLHRKNAARTMSDAELVDRIVMAGQDIFAQTNLATEVQKEILNGIARIVVKKLSSRKVTGESGVVPAASPDGKAAAAAADGRNQPEDILTAEMLGAMKLRDRKAALERHYQGRTPWADVRPGKPQEPAPDDFEQWADSNFPDRRRLGLVLSDLRALDKEAYGKLRHWANPRGNAVKIDPARFGFPSKVVRYDPAKPAPTGAQVFEAFDRGDPRASELRRDYMRARYHLQRNN